MRHPRSLLTLIALLALASQAHAVKLVVDHEPVATIVIPDDALPVESFAAEELRHHLQRSTGARLLIVPESEADLDAGAVLIGACRATAAMGVDAEALPINGFIIRADRDRLVLTGDDSDGPAAWILHNNRTRVGTLFAVYHLLDRHLGVRWLWPGPLGEVIPQRADIAFDQLDETGKPAFVHARWRDGGPVVAGTDGWASPDTRSTFISAQGAWLRRHRFALGVNMDMKHAFTSWWEEHGEQHPEYFNLLPDGTRRPDPNYWGGSPRLVSMCVSEPAFHRAIVEDWQRTRSESNPYVDASENDTAGKCTCPRCMGWDVPDPELGVPWDQRLAHARAAFEAGESDWHRFLGSLSDRYARYYLAVQEQARQIDPEAVVMGFAYANYRRPPRETSLNDHIIIGIVPGVMFPWTDERAAEMRSQWEGWAATGARLLLRPNYMLDGHNMPLFMAHKIGREFRTCAEQGMIGTDFDSLTGQYATRGPDLYTLARLHARPELSVDDVLDEFYAAFGSARAAVQAYFAHWREVSDAVAERPEDLHWASFYRQADEVFTAEAMSRGEDLLARAEAAAAGDETALARVRFLQDGLRNARLTLQTQAAYDRYRESGAIRPYREALQRLDDFRASVEADLICNMAFLAWAEQRTWDRKLLSLMAEPGERLSGPWRFRWDPEGVGEQEGWHREDHPDGDWQRIGVDGPWEEQPVGRQWREEHGQDYDGFAWYRTAFTVEREAERPAMRLVFGAVDEACTVWLNGEKVLERPYPYEGDADSWQKAFEVDVTEVVRHDEPNVLAVRVEDNAGAGGIWRPVWLAHSAAAIDDEANLIENGGFEDASGAWKKHVMCGEFAFALDPTAPHGGRLCAMLRCTAAGPPEAEEQHRTRVWGRWYQPVGAVEPERTYRLRLWVRTSDDFGGRVAIWVTGAGGGTMAANVLNTEGLWRELTIDAITPDGDQLGVYLN
ncbi:MAG: DUF4838 domain-containing protein, partial [Armatimonadota bacterium]